MKKKKVDRIPEFKSFREEAEFWETHSLADYWDKWKDVDLVLELSKPQSETLILRVQKSLKEKLQELAKKKGVTPSTLARIWLMEKLRASI